MTTARLLEITARNNPSLFERLTLRIGERLKRKAARNALMRLDDHMLKDIGLSRGSIMSDEF